MSEYCYQCEGCGNFKENCVCPEFEDPMGEWREMTNKDIALELKN